VSGRRAPSSFLLFLPPFPVVVEVMPPHHKFPPAFSPPPPPPPPPHPLPSQNECQEKGAGPFGGPPPPTMGFPTLLLTSLVCVDECDTSLVFPIQSVPSSLVRFRFLVLSASLSSLTLRRRLCADRDGPIYGQLLLPQSVQPDPPSQSCFFPQNLEFGG